MEDSEQAKENLLVYLQANLQYIEEKVYNQFNVECIQQKTLDTLSVPKMIATIQAIFDFGDNDIYSYFFSHLEFNIRAYVAQQYKNKAVKSFYILDIEKLIDIVKYCINHGFDPNKPKKKSSPPPPPPPPLPPLPPPQPKPVKKVEPEPKKEVEKKDQFAHVKPRISTFLQADKLAEKKEFKLEKFSMPEVNVKPKVSTFSDVKLLQKKQFKLEKYEMPNTTDAKPRVSTFLEVSKLPEKKEFKIEKFSMPETNVLPRYLASVPKAQPRPKEEQLPLTVAPIDQSYLQSHRKTIRERLLKLFNFYCLQQQSLGQGPTFDHIKGQGESMNLGKFMQFCQSTRLFACKEMTKDVLIAEFKKIAEGKLQIGFDLFQGLLIALDEKYLKFAGNDPVNNPMPTYEARLMLNEPGKLGEVKKQRHLAFGTRSKEGREAVSIDEGIRYKAKQLTLHSGRFSSDLQIGLKSKPQMIKEPRQPKTTRAKQSDLINLSDLNKLKLPKLSWMDDLLEEPVKNKLEKKF